ncbi:uncharacterized protein [Typha angustifolia]|uniref:uncharacterized protein isoform X2 n=1 Tax=Typha angustifolia TaxID=59011 RepID=UPI003C2CBDC4
MVKKSSRSRKKSSVVVNDGCKRGKGEEAFNNGVQILSVKDLLGTRLLEGEPITYVSRKHQVELRGFIRGNGYQCGCTSCNYNDQVLTAVEFEKHAGMRTHNQNNHILLSNGRSLYQVVKHLENVPRKLCYDEIFKVTGVVRKINLEGSNSSSMATNGPNRLMEKVEETSEAPTECTKSFSHTSVDFSSCTRNTKESKVLTRYTPRSLLVDVRGLLSTGLLEGLTVRYKKDEVEVHGIIRDLGILCGCSSCNCTKVVSAYQFEKHAGVTSSNQNNHIFLESGISLYNLVKELKNNPLYLLGDMVKEKIGRPPNLKSFEDWKGLFRMGDDNPNISTNAEKIQPEVDSKRHSAQSSQGSVAEGIADPARGGSLDSALSANCPCTSMAVAEGNKLTASNLFTTNCSKKEDTSELDKRVLYFSQSSGNSVQQKPASQSDPIKKDILLHQLVFQENGLPDGTELTYRIRGKIQLTGYKRGNCIVCDCHKEELSPSQFEAHAGMAQRRQPYHNIYTSDGKTLHELSINLFSGQKSAAIGTEDLCSVCGDGGELVYCDGCPKLFHSGCLQLHIGPNDERLCSYCVNRFESRVASNIAAPSAVGPINPRLRRVLTRVIEDGCCTICKSNVADTSGVITRATIIFCNQEVRRFTWVCGANCSAIRCALEIIVHVGKKVIPGPLLSILKNNFRERGLISDAEADIDWQLLSGKAAQNDMLLSDAVKVFQGAFDVIVAEGDFWTYAMVYGKQVDTGKRYVDFRGMHCAVIKVKSVVVSAAIIRIFGRNVAELPLIATRKEWQGLGLCRTLLSLIEQLVRHLNVELLITPVDDEKQSIWMNKFGFVKATDQKMETLKEHSILRFQNTTIMEKKVNNSR